MKILYLETFLFEEENHVRETALGFEPFYKVVEILEVGYDGLLEILGFSQGVHVHLLVEFGDGLDGVSFQFGKGLLYDFECEGFSLLDFLMYECREAVDFEDKLAL